MTIYSPDVLLFQYFGHLMRRTDSFRLKLKKVGKTTRPFRFGLNQIPYDYMWAVKIQRSDRPLPWDFWASSRCSLHTYHHSNSYHPAHCRAPALAVTKAPPPNSPRNVPGFLLLVFYLNYILLMPSSSDSYHIWFHRCGVLFFFFFVVATSHFCHLLSLSFPSESICC